MVVIAIPTICINLRSGFGQVPGADLNVKELQIFEIVTRMNSIWLYRGEDLGKKTFEIFSAEWNKFTQFRDAAPPVSVQCDYIHRIYFKVATLSPGVFNVANEVQLGALVLRFPRNTRDDNVSLQKEITTEVAASILNETSTSDRRAEKQLLYIFSGFSPLADDLVLQFESGFIKNVSEFLRILKCDRVDPGSRDLIDVSLPSAGLCHLLYRFTQHGRFFSERYKKSIKSFNSQDVLAAELNRRCAMLTETGREGMMAIQDAGQQCSKIGASIKEHDGWLHA
jgi:hypothetical protein